jgi:hypothetical protein
MGASCSTSPTDETLRLAASKPAKGALNVMNPNIYLTAIVFSRLAQRNQKQKALPEPEFRRFDLTYLTGAPGKRDHS